MQITDEGADMLAYAIVAQAIADWYKARRAVLRGRTHVQLENNGIRPASVWLEELERFFRGRWFALICDLDGELLLRVMQQADIRRGVLWFR